MDIERAARSHRSEHDGPPIGLGSGWKQKSLGRPKSVYRNPVVLLILLYQGYAESRMPFFFKGMKADEILEYKKRGQGRREQNRCTLGQRKTWDFILKTTDVLEGLQHVITLFYKNLSHCSHQYRP